MVRVRSRWRVIAEQTIERVLADLPKAATDKQKRDAVRAAYPFGERQYLPYKHWLAAQREALGTSSLPEAPKPSPVVLLEGIPAELGAIVLALAADPADEVTQAALCDWLEEHGNGRATEARALKASAEGVAKQMHPKCEVYHESTIASSVLMVRARDGSGAKFRLAIISEQLDGRTLLIDPAVTEAARLVRGRMLLKCVLGEE